MTPRGREKGGSSRDLGLGRIGAWLIGDLWGAFNARVSQLLHVHGVLRQGRVWGFWGFGFKHILEGQCSCQNWIQLTVL